MTDGINARGTRSNCATARTYDKIRPAISNPPRFEGKPRSESPVPGPLPHRGSATTHPCSQATSWHSSPSTADSLGPFAMYAAFLRSDYYGPSVPSRDHQPTMSLPAADLAGRR